MFLCQHAARFLRENLDLAWQSCARAELRLCQQAKRCREIRLRYWVRMEPIDGVLFPISSALEQNDVTAARPLLEIVGPITAVPTEAEGERFLTAHFPGMSAEEESLLSLADGTMVAGAGYVRIFPHLPPIPLVWR